MFTPRTRKDNVKRIAKVKERKVTRTERSKTLLKHRTKIKQQFLLNQYLKLALGLKPEVLTRCMAEFDEAVRKGAKRGPGSIWPDPNVKLDKPQSKFSEHWVHKGLLLTFEAAKASRANILQALKVRDARIAATKTQDARGAKKTS